MILTIDPGKHFHGCALWEDTELAGAWYCESDAFLDELVRHIDVLWINQVVVERMQIYPQTGVAKANDLLEVENSAGRAIGCIKALTAAEVTRVYASKWKGQVPKQIMTDRIIAKLPADEAGRIELPTAKSKHHNVWDAVGIGLWELRRL